MRLSFLVTMLVLLLSITSAQLLALTGAVKGAAALGSSIAKLAAAVVPTGLLVPLAMVGPLKLSLPFLLGLKGLGLLKLKLLMLKAPLLAPIGIGAAKVGLFNAKAKFAKNALVTTGKAKLSLIGLPFKLTAMKIGAVAGAKAGAKAGLASVQQFPRSHFIHPMVIPASALLSQARAEALPTVAGPAILSASDMPQPQQEIEEAAPLYGRKPATTTTTTTTMTTRPAPAYTPEPLQLSYRKRRNADSEDTFDQELLSDTFKYIQERDVDSCIQLAVCEIAIDPHMAGSHGPDFIQLMTALDNSNKTAPWMPYKNAVELGSSVKKPDACRSRYDSCKKPAVTTVAIAKERLDSVGA